MRVVWALEKIEGRNWNQQVELMQKSARAWDSIYPSDTRALYVDEYSWNSLGTLRETKMFDEVNKFSYESFPSISPKVFWASGKLRAIREQTEPFILVDNDFELRGDIKKHLQKDRACFNFLETTLFLYPSPTSPEIRSLNLDFRLSNFAANTSFFYSPDPEFTSDYAFRSLSAMEMLSKQGVDSSVYMIFTEQQFFYSLVSFYKKEYQCLHRQVFDSFNNVWLEDTEPRGIFSESEVDTYFSHMGLNK